MGALLEGRPQPTGALAGGLKVGAAAQAQAAGGAVKTAFDAFTNAALRSKGSSAEMELSRAASRWVVPLEGPLAGAVLLSDDEVPEEHARYPSVANFVAALRLRPHTVLAKGGCVSYAVPEHGFLLYIPRAAPRGRPMAAAGVGAAGAERPPP
jgi:hypothetical protein